MSEALPSTTSLLLRVSLPNGLHLRPSGNLASAINDIFPTQQFNVTISGLGKTIDARSIAAILEADIRYDKQCSLNITPINGDIIAEKLLTNIRTELRQIGLQEIAPST